MWLNSVVEHWNSDGETVWWNSGTVMEEQCWWNSVVEQLNSGSGTGFPDLFYMLIKFMLITRVV